MSDLARIEKALETLPPEACRIMAVRAGLRVFPALVYMTDEDGILSPEDCKITLLPTLRALALAFNASALPGSPTTKTLAAEAAAATDEAADTAPEAAIVHAIDAAFAAVSALLSDNAVEISVLAIRAVHAAGNSAGYAVENAADSGAASHAIEVACAWDLAHIDTCLAAPLWPEAQPAQMAALWTRLKAALPKGAAYVEARNWYDARLRGEPASADIFGF